MITIINNFLDKIFNSHSIVISVGSETLINLDVGYWFTIVILLSSALFIGFFAFKLIRWIVKYVG